jgi:hypothetical protein
MTPLAHVVVGMTGWKFSSRREDIRALFIFMFAAGAVDLDFLQNMIALMCEVIVFVVPAAYICRKELAYLWRTIIRKSASG